MTNISRQERRKLSCMENSGDGISGCGRVWPARPSIPLGYQAAAATVCGLFWWHQSSRNELVDVSACVTQSIDTGRHRLDSYDHQLGRPGPF